MSSNLLEENKELLSDISDLFWHVERRLIETFKLSNSSTRSGGAILSGALQHPLGLNLLEFGRRE